MTIYELHFSDNLGRSGSDQSASAVDSTVVEVNLTMRAGARSAEGVVAETCGIEQKSWGRTDSCVVGGR